MKYQLKIDFLPIALYDENPEKIIQRTFDKFSKNFV